jgi:hypothetical protein
MRRACSFLGKDEHRWAVTPFVGSYASNRGKLHSVETLLGKLSLTIVKGPF